MVTDGAGELTEAAFDGEQTEEADGEPHRRSGWVYFVALTAIAMTNQTSQTFDLAAARYFCRCSKGRVGSIHVSRARPLNAAYLRRAFGRVDAQRVRISARAGHRFAV